MYTYNADVACMSETNSYWKNQRCYNKFYSVVRKFWKIFHLTTSETKTSWPTIYKPGGTATIPTTNLSTRITSSDPKQKRENYGTIPYQKYIVVKNCSNFNQRSVFQDG